MAKVRIKFWGVRGSMAAPGSKTVKIGGNTACVEIAADGAHIICDAGTGIRPLGQDLQRRMKGKRCESFIMLSHLHWDHYIGLPFFVPLYSSKNRFTIAGPRAAGEPFGRALSRVMHPPYFPIPVSAIPSKVRFRTLGTRRFRIGPVTVVPAEVNHPGGALGWRFQFPNGKTLVHVTDDEPGDAKNRARLVRWMREADLLIHDAQYTPTTYAKHIGWGHSPYTYPLELAEAAGIPRVVFFHFDPADDDRRILGVQRDARAWLRKRRSKVRCSVAREGETILL